MQDSSDGENVGTDDSDNNLPGNTGLVDDEDKDFNRDPVEGGYADPVEDGEE